MAKNHHTPSIVNCLLGSLPPDDFALIESQLEPVELARRLVLERPQVPIEHVYFPNRGIASIVAGAGRDRRVEVGLFGREGMSGAAVVMGDDRSPQECFVQVAGEGQRITSEGLREAMGTSPTLRLFLLHYVQALLVQTGHTALANAQAQIEERLCRWLLMCHDRVEGDELPLTHEFLATMLGVRRAGVTTAVHALAGRGLIRALRASIEILDRKGLEVCADGIYGVPEAVYQRLVGVSFREAKS